MALQAPFVPAIVTPFEEGSLKVDEANFVKYLKFLWQSGYTDIIVNGSTGEFPSMTLEERETVTRVARENWPGQAVVNISTCNVADSLRLLQHAQSSSSSSQGEKRMADGVLLLPPYYFAASTAAGFEAFFQAILREARIPVYLYNFPANMGALIPVELYTKLGHEFPNLAGIKNTFDDLPLSKKFKDALPDRQVYVGHDPSCLDCLREGFDGAIAATASVDPDSLLGVAKAYEEGNAAAAEGHMSKLNKWNAYVAENKINIFAAVKAGIRHHLPDFPLAVRPPLVKASQAEAQNLLSVLQS